MDSKILEYRLLTRESVIGGAYCLSKVAGRIQTYLKLAEQLRGLTGGGASDVSGEVVEARDVLFRELQLYKLEVDKSQHMSKVAPRILEIKICQCL